MASLSRWVPRSDSLHRGGRGVQGVRGVTPSDAVRQGKGHVQVQRAILLSRMQHAHTAGVIVTVAFVECAELWLVGALDNVAVLCNQSGSCTCGCASML